MIEGAILIAGPTASGKSAAAVELASRIGGVIINADSMQVYSVLDVLTARPDRESLRRVPHLLYGHVHPSVHYSVGQWCRDVGLLVQAGALEGRRPIFVGGTGLYFKALTEGLSEIPPVPAIVRRRWRDALAIDGAHKLHEMLSALDPETAASLSANDGQRIVRALEVVEATGRSIRSFQTGRSPATVDRSSATALVIEPDRPILRSRIATRFERMIEMGAELEAQALGALLLPPSMPAMKAIGVRELLAAQRSEISLSEAVERSMIATGQYAKRQSTWFRNQFGAEWQRVSDGEELLLAADRRD